MPLNLETLVKLYPRAQGALSRMMGYLDRPTMVAPPEELLRGTRLNSIQSPTWLTTDPQVARLYAEGTGHLQRYKVDTETPIALINLNQFNDTNRKTSAIMDAFGSTESLDQFLKSLNHPNLSTGYKLDQVMDWALSRDSNIPWELLNPRKKGFPIHRIPQDQYRYFDTGPLTLINESRSY
jgi:hypothetical protein